MHTRSKVLVAILGRSALLGTVFASLSLGQVARAQQPPGSPGQPAPRQDPRDVKTPSAQAAEDYRAKGVPVGSFLLFPELEADEVYNDNIYATPKTLSGQTGSFIQLIKPSAELRSNWNNHMLNFFARGAFGIYSANSSENFQDFSVGTDGRLDIQRNWNVYGGASFSGAHEERGTPNNNIASTEPNKYDQLAGNVGYYQKLNRFSGRLDARLDNYNYINQGAGPANGSIFNADRNRIEFREAARFGYEFLQGTEAWVRGSLNQRRYVNGVDTQGFMRNSSGFDVVGGLALDLGGITSVEAFGGYIQQDYVDARFPQIKAPTFGVIGYWNPMRELTIKPYIRRTIDDSSLTTAAAYLSTAFGLDVDYQARPNVKLGAHGDYSLADYSQISGNSFESDQYLTLRADATYNLTSNFFTGLSYQFRHRSSNLPNNDYNQNVVMLRLGARL